MNYSGSFAGAGPRFGAERPYDARFEGMRPATVVDEADEVGNAPLNDGRDPNFFHEPQFTGGHYSGYDNARCVGWANGKPQLGLKPQQRANTRRLAWHLESESKPGPRDLGPKAPTQFPSTPSDSASPNLPGRGMPLQRNQETTRTTRTRALNGHKRHRSAEDPAFQYLEGQPTV